MPKRILVRCALSIQLGRWVKFPRQPHCSYRDPTPTDITLSSLSSSKPLDQSYKDGNGTLLASRPLNNSLDIDSTKPSTTHLLINPVEWFDSTIKHHDNRSWIQGALSTSPSVYMVIGYQEVQNQLVAILYRRIDLTYPKTDPAHLDNCWSFIWEDVPRNYPEDAKYVTVQAVLAIKDREDDKQSALQYELIYIDESGCDFLGRRRKKE